MIRRLYIHNYGCLLNFELPVEAAKELGEISKIDLPFPQKFFVDGPVQDVLYGGVRNQMLDSRY